ncbi:hypothetical protein Y032_0124g1228 [Ancylostoma ceylanicum]|uniref:Uncharacterized protein n=1 Tax=Ancylostoma ceylanicum TaxID=53326 RepID=A0A016T942_9BILA|nr:hypothetical protein Y032_0124g1228 [Ancylostoma ceylanicum]
MKCLTLVEKISLYLVALLCLVAWSRRAHWDTVVHTSSTRANIAVRLIFEFSFCCAVTREGGFPWYSLDMLISLSFIVISLPGAAGPPLPCYDVLRKQCHLPSNIV